jgi:hypothetical protein
MGSGHGGRNQRAGDQEDMMRGLPPQWGPATEAGIRACGKSSL